MNWVTEDTKRSNVLEILDAAKWQGNKVFITKTSSRSNIGYMKLPNDILVMVRPGDDYGVDLYLCEEQRMKKLNSRPLAERNPDWETLKKYMPDSAKCIPLESAAHWDELKAV